MNRKLRITLIVTPVVLLVVAIGGLFAYGWKEEGPPMWWVLWGSNVQKVVVHWDTKRIEVTDPNKVQNFVRTIRKGNSPMPYATRCLPDDNPENWSITLIRRGQKPLQFQIGTDSCGTFYLPEVGSTYSTSAEIYDLIDSVVEKS